MNHIPIGASMNHTPIGASKLECDQYVGSPVNVHAWADSEE